MDLDKLLRLMAARNASDLFLGVGAPPAMKIDGVLQMLDEPALDSQTVSSIADGLFDAERKAAFARTHEMNLTVAIDQVGRFRVNIYRQRSHTGIAIRFIPARIADFDELNLPSVLRELIMLPRGLVLVVGGAGSGKSTTLASMIDYRNHNRAGHILTIEDPIEYLHAHDKSLVDQREVGIDTLSYAEAMRNAMRQSPDVIMIGEIRDRVTMEQALAYAQTGQLCLATLHANNANQTLDRILTFFPDQARKQVLLDLSHDLKAVVSQRLVPSAAGGRRVPAVELLLQTSYVSDLIRAGEIDKLKDAMKQGVDDGMLTFEESLMHLHQSGQIGLNDALANADSRSDLQLRLRLSEPLSMDNSADKAMGIESNKREIDPGHDAWTDGKSHHPDRNRES